MSSEESIISQPAGIRTLALRESYLAICGGDKCEAHLLNANERWYAYKLKERQQARHRNKVARDGGEIPEADESLWVFMSAAKWVEELLGIYDEKTVRRKLASLVERGFLATRSNPKKRWDRTAQWMFMRGKVQTAVDAWASTRPTPDLDPSDTDTDSEQDGNDGQDDADNSPPSIRENARMEPGKVPDGAGQSSESSRANARSNTTGISLRDLSQGSPTGLEEGEPSAGDDDHAARYDGGQKEKQEETTAADDEKQAHTPATGAVPESPGGELGGDAEGGEDVPPAAAPAAWDPAAVNARLDQLFNKRWLTSYRERGTGPVQPALITETDGTGVDRRDLARLISPEHLEDLVKQVRRDRARAEEAARTESSVKVYTMQHLLIQAMSSHALRVLNLEAVIEEYRAVPESDLSVRPLDDDGREGSLPISGPLLTLQQPRLARVWQVGDLVSYAGEQYRVIRVTDRHITIDNGQYDMDVNLHNAMIDSVKLVAAATLAAEASA